MLQPYTEVRHSPSLFYYILLITSWGEPERAPHCRMIVMCVGVAMAASRARRGAVSRKGRSMEPVRSTGHCVGDPSVQWKRGLENDQADCSILLYTTCTSVTIE